MIFPEVFNQLQDECQETYAIFVLGHHYRPKLYRLAAISDKNREKNLCPSWDLNLTSPVLRTGALLLDV